MKDMILILNDSTEFSMEAARQLRAEHISVKLMPGGMTAEEILALSPKGIILGGDAGEGEKLLCSAVFGLDIPVLAMGGAAIRMLACLGGASADTALENKKAAVAYGKSDLFTGISNGERLIERAYTLMLPPDVQEIASAAGCTMAFEHEEKKLYGVQFEPERNDPEGTAILFNFARYVCGCADGWTLDTALEEAQQVLTDAAADGGHALCAVSGGVDSTVAAYLTRKVFGEKMTAVFVDTGLMRSGELENVRKAFEALDIPLHMIDCSGEILEQLTNKRRNEEKQRVVEHSIDAAILRFSASVEGRKTLVLGTNYSDYLDNGSSAEKWKGMAVAEPLLDMFKHEVRELARQLGMGPDIVDRKPFPALGLGGRIIGEATGERLQALRMAEVIFRREIAEAGFERKLYKYFPVLVGNDEVPGKEMMILRAVTLSAGQLIPARLPYDLVERTVQQIMADCPSITRVFYDQTPTPIGKETFV